MQNNRFSSFDGKKKNLLHWILELGAMVILLLIVFNVLVGVSRVSGDSMAPELRDSQLVFYTRVGFDPQVGDKVFVVMPSGDKYLKRIVATGGSQIDIEDGQVLIDGEAEAGSYISYVTETEMQSDLVKYPYVVEEGRFFIMGDNRAGSVDSRSFGSVSRSQIRGKIFLAI